jgi:hypothetical protein
MASLTGSSVATTYDQLLTLPSGGGNTTTLVALTDGDGVNTFCLQLATTSALIVDDAKLYFGTGSDASFEYDEDGNDVLLYDGANFRIEDDTQLQFGAAADWTVEYDEDGDDDLVFTGSDMAIESSTTAKPLVLIKNTTDDQVGAELRFVATQGGTNGVDNDVAGTISFYSNDDGTPTNQKFAQMVCKATDVTSGGEEGSLSFGVAEYDGTVTDGLVLTGQPADGEVDVTIGAGASSTTTIAGDLTMTAGDIKMNGSAGQGIDFSGSQDAADAGSMTSEVLDSYEEGTWDAVVTDGTNPMTMNGSADTGYYTKVGNLVTVTGYFITTSLGSASGGIRLTGLPFTIADNYAAFTGGGAAYAEGLAITAGHSVGYYGAINDTYININVWDATTGISLMQASEWTADGQIILGFSYRAA